MSARARDRVCAIANTTLGDCFLLELVVSLAHSCDRVLRVPVRRSAGRPAGWPSQSSADKSLSNSRARARALMHLCARCRAQEKELNGAINTHENHNKDNSNNHHLGKSGAVSRPPQRSGKYLHSSALGDKCVCAQVCVCACVRACALGERPKWRHGDIVALASAPVTRIILPKQQQRQQQPYATKTRAYEARWPKARYMRACMQRNGTCCAKTRPLSLFSSRARAREDTRVRWQLRQSNGA